MNSDSDDEDVSSVSANTDDADNELGSEYDRYVQLAEEVFEKWIAKFQEEGQDVTDEVLLEQAAKISSVADAQERRLLVKVTNQARADALCEDDDHLQRTTPIRRFMPEQEHDYCYACTRSTGTGSSDLWNLYLSMITATHKTRIVQALHEMYESTIRSAVARQLQSYAQVRQMANVPANVASTALSAQAWTRESIAEHYFTTKHVPGSRIIGLVSYIYETCEAIEALRSTMYRRVAMYRTVVQKNIALIQRLEERQQRARAELQSLLPAGIGLTQEDKLMRMIAESASVRGSHEVAGYNVLY